MAKNNLEQKRFNRLSEAAIAYQTKDKNQQPLVKALVEAYNTKFKTRFYFDEERSEIIHANLVSEANFADYKKLSGLLQAKGIRTTIKESVVQNLNGLSRLVESELAQAEIILAAQGLSDRLQKMAEDLAQMVSEDVLPISDQMKSVFGTQQAEKWSDLSKSALEEAFATISKTKDVISNANLVLERQLEGNEVPVDDMANFDSDTSDDDLALDAADNDELGADGEIDDFFGGSDASSGPKDEPLGRAKKESIQYRKKPLKENENKRQPGELSPSDFDIVYNYKGYVLAADEHDDGDVVKHSYYIVKPTRTMEVGNGYKPIQMYKKIKNLGLGSYVPEHEVRALFKKTVDKMGTNEDRSTGNLNSYIPIMYKTQAEQPFVLTHDGNNVLITKGHNITDDTALFYGDEARELLNDLDDADQSEHQQILAHYYASKFNAVNRDRAKNSPDEWSKLSEHDDPTPYIKKIENKGYKVRVTDRNGVKYFAVTKQNDFDEFTSNNEILHVKEPKSGVYIIDMDYKAKFSSLEDAVDYHFGNTSDKGFYDDIKEHEDHADYVSELESEGYTVEVNEQGDSLIFVVSKDGKTVVIEEPEEGVYKILSFGKTYNTLKDAVSAFYTLSEMSCKMVRERNAFAYAVRKAKSIGADNFEVDGKKYPVKETNNKTGEPKNRLPNPFTISVIDELQNQGFEVNTYTSTEYNLPMARLRYGDFEFDVFQLPDGNFTSSITNKIYKDISFAVYDAYDHIPNDVKEKYHATNLDYWLYPKTGRAETENVKENDDEDLADKAINVLKGDKKPKQKPNPIEDRLKKDMVNTIKRNPQLKMSLSKMQEAINTIKEDISLGINEKLAIRNSSMIFELPLQDLREEWMAAKK